MIASSCSKVSFFASIENCPFPQVNIQFKCFPLCGICNGTDFFSTVNPEIFEYFQLISKSLHAPYFINLANPDPQALEKTIGYITGACLVAGWMGAGRVIIHSGALMKRTRREAMDTALRSLKAVIQACDDGGFGHISLCPETMGKINQLGDLDEVLELCTVDERLVPCVDFGHLYARSLGALDGAEAMDAMLDRMKAVLGEARARVFHSHFSHIEFTPNGGEKCHRTFADDGGYGPDWSPLAAAVARRGWSPTFICESAGTQAQDALEMKRIYLRQMQGE